MCDSVPDDSRHSIFGNLQAGKIGWEPHKPARTSNAMRPSRSTADRRRGAQDRSEGDHFINVTCKLQGKQQTIAVEPTSSISKLRELLAEKDGVQPSTVKVVHGGKDLDESMTLEQANVADGAALVLVKLVKPKSFTLTIKTLKDKFFSIPGVDEATSVIDLKRRVEEQDPQWELARQRIIYQGRELEDAELISKCGLDDSNPSVHLVMRLPAPGCARKKKVDETLRGKAPMGTQVKKEEEEEPVFVLGLDEMEYTSGNSHLALDDVLGGCSSTPMEFETAWQEYDAEPALPSTGWESEMNILTSPGPTPRAATNESPIDAVMAISVESSPQTPISSPPSHPTSVSKEPKGAQKDEKEPTACPSTQGRAYDLTKVDDKLRKRLLKNRLSAERSRQRKQAHVETLEFELSCCRSENEALKKRIASLESQVAALSMGGQASLARQIVVI